MTGDSYKYQGQRKQLVDLLRQKGIRHEGVLEAIGSIPRHLFLDSQFDRFAYQDTAFKIGAGQTISQPYTVAFQTALLKPEPGLKVLEIGTGSGYQTCVLAALKMQIFSVERQRLLYDRSKVLLRNFPYKLRLFYGDGYAGKKAYAPFDRILVTCGAPEVPESLLEQLAPGGILVIPVGAGETQEMLRIHKSMDGTYQQESFGTFRFVPMLPERATDN